MFIVCSTFKVAPENADDIDALYKFREHLVDGFEGFLGIDVFRNDADPTEFTLLARWADKKNYEVYRRSEAFGIAHRRMLDLSRKVRVQAGSHSIKYMNHIAS